jgi:hypothetical protein
MVISAALGNLSSRRILTWLEQHMLLGLKRLCKLLFYLLDIRSAFNIIKPSVSHIWDCMSRFSTSAMFVWTMGLEIRGKDNVGCSEVWWAVSLCQTSDLKVALDVVMATAVNFD